MIIKRSRVCACTSERAQIAPRWLVKRRAKCIAPSGTLAPQRSITRVTAPTSLPFWIILLSAQVRCAPLVLRTVFAPPRQTAEEQSAAFALISELLDANALDYHAAGNSLRAKLAFSIFSMNIPYPSVGSATITCVTAPTSLPS